MNDLFSFLKEKEDIREGNIIVPDLIYEQNFLSIEDADGLMDKIDNSEWSCELSRRVQHYGFKYNYKSRYIDNTMKAIAIPDWLTGIGQKLVDDGFFKKNPDQVIVNEYKPGQGIAPHVDCVPCFGETVASLSLLSPCIMQLTSIENSKTVNIDLNPASVIIFSGDARYKWKHSIIARKNDVINNISRPRQRRVSITFRTVIL